MADAFDKDAFRKDTAKGEANTIKGLLAGGASEEAKKAAIEACKLAYSNDAERFKAVAKELDGKQPGADPTMTFHVDYAGNDPNRTGVPEKISLGPRIENVPLIGHIDLGSVDIFKKDGNAVVGPEFKPITSEEQTRQAAEQAGKFIPTVGEWDSATKSLKAYLSGSTPEDHNRKNK